MSATVNQKQEEVSTETSSTTDAQKGAMAGQQPSQLAQPETQKQAARRRGPVASKKVKKVKSVFVSSKRKTAVARAVITKGSGRITVNNIDINLFEPKELRSLMLEPINVLSMAKELASAADIKISVHGGGVSAQAQAVRSAIAKSIAEYSESDTIRNEYLKYNRAFIVGDPRRVEPKKFKGPKARARFQTSYR